MGTMGNESNRFYRNNRPSSKSSQSQRSRSRKERKPLTVFEEYERRGGVLEDYEDLNSDRSGSNDHVLN